MSATSAPASEDSAAIEADTLAASKVAQEGLAAFADHERSYEEWWADVAPRLSTEAQEMFQYTDPANVPVSEVTGDARLMSEAGGMLVFEVPTDIGNYRVDLVREMDGGPWTIHYFHPPEDP